MNRDKYRDLMGSFLKLVHVVEEMQTRGNYYLAPGEGEMPIVMPGKIEKWVSKLTMARNGLEHLLKEYEGKE